MTKIEDMRSPCAIANSLEILGDRWTLLIIRDLMFTNRREFGHFLQAGEGISTNILAERLQRLQCHGVITKTPHPEHGKKFLYQLSDTGLKLAPTIIELALWGSETIEGAFVPPHVMAMMRGDKEKLLVLINARQCLVELEL